MSKSKLNRRQLKKISKLAMNALVDHFGSSLPDCGFCKDSGEYWVFYTCYFGECNERTSFEDLGITFANEWDFTTKACLVEEWNSSHRYTKDFYAMTFVNQIHYMIKFLEGGNE